MLSLSLPLVLLTRAAIISAASLPISSRQIQNDSPSTQPTYIACVTDAKISSLTSSVAIAATSRKECSTTCAQHDWEIAYYRQDTSQCFCSPASDYPTSDEVVSAVDELGNCRSEDDASVEYLRSPYTLSKCYLYLTPPSPTTNLTTSSPLSCLDSCNTTSVAVRPELDTASDQFVYECGCYDGVVGVGQVADCGYGAESVYARI
ncbi:hypothetical protein IAR55_001007 [Kwoniella newhampshirensis]|uniref:WSC domain-containing protein n=1 Tax=Kwoniella newhampshirensis TaxID=1651941 RepID=A0AAW0Z4M0_9TREE